MIDKNMPEPDVKECHKCFRRNRLKGKLIHWPSEKCDKDIVKTPGFLGSKGIETFSVWIYTCAWCRGVETKRQKRVLR